MNNTFSLCPQVSDIVCLIILVKITFSELLISYQKTSSKPAFTVIDMHELVRCCVPQFYSSPELNQDHF